MTNSELKLISKFLFFIGMLPCFIVFGLMGETFFKDTPNILPLVIFLGFFFFFLLYGIFEFLISKFFLSPTKSSPQAETLSNTTARLNPQETSVNKEEALFKLLRQISLPQNWISTFENSKEVQARWLNLEKLEILLGNISLEAQKNKDLQKIELLEKAIVLLASLKAQSWEELKKLNYSLDSLILVPEIHRQKKENTPTKKPKKSQKAPALEIQKNNLAIQQCKKEPVPIKQEYISPEVSELLKALKNPQDKIRQHAFQELGKLGPKAKAAVPSLIQIIRNNDWVSDDFQGAFKTLSLIGPVSEEVLLIFVQILESENLYYYIRKEAARVLSQFGSKAELAVPALIYSLEEEKVAYYSALALCKIGVPTFKAVQVLSQELNNPKHSDEAKQALLHLGTEALPHLVEIIKEEPSLVVERILLQIFSLTFQSLKTTKLEAKTVQIISGRLEKTILKLIQLHDFNRGSSPGTKKILNWILKDLQSNQKDATQRNFTQATQKIDTLLKQLETQQKFSTREAQWA